MELKNKNQTGIMKVKCGLSISLLAALCFVISSCSDKDYYEDEDDFTPQTYNVLGKVEKGPFVSGSTITVQPMDSKLEASGEFYSAIIQDNMGNFSFGSKLFQAPYAELTANGYFFNEVEGELSSGTLNLRALVDLSDETTVNVNILTHLKYQRVQNLVNEGKKFSDANKQAQKELFTAFGLQKYSDTDASQFTITKGTNESAALIAISSLLIVDRNEAELTEYLAKLTREFGQNGTFSAATKEQIKKDRKELASQLSYIRENVIYRYEELGLDVEVKELAMFLDWDDDGIAGNETLLEGQEVVLEETELEVPNGGGEYKIKFISPIPIYLTSPVAGNNPSESISPDDYFKDIYDNIVSTDISLEKEIEDDLLTITISPLKSRTSKSVSIYLYDCLGNIVATVNLSQEGSNDISLPKLGDTGKQVVARIASSMGRGFSYMSLIEQYYYYNKTGNMVSEYISPSSPDVYNIWQSLYEANNLNLMFKDAESKQLGLYQDIFNVFSALNYYNMVVFWGDVPYVQEYNSHGGFYISRTPQSEILNSLKEKLISAIEYLDEKKNESLKDVNDYFFVSKDVARILLADIYMYQGDYANAEVLLSKVIENGYYELDSSKYTEIESTEDLWNNASGKESIFIIKNIVSIRSTINRPNIIPLMNYTDVILSYAECLYKNGNTAKAKTYLDKVVLAKNITVSNDVFTGIKDARMQLLLYSVGNFAFLKRNNLAKEDYGVEDYRLVLPIPIEELSRNPQMTPNPGY